MRARAPGKVVISGAYAVLDGAPAIVSAVSRYVLADSSRASERVTPEVEAALGGSAPAPWFDASALRSENAKLGLGSSAAILVASLAARELDAGPSDDDALAKRVFPPALRAHRKAQGGGSGVDVLASAYGGTLVARLSGGELPFQRIQLPSRLTFQVWAAQAPASTPELLARVRGLEKEDPTLHARLIGALSEAAERAVDALDDDEEFLAALSAQRLGLQHLGEAAGAPIVMPAIVELATRAKAEGAVVVPAGAGGGDVALYVGVRPPTRALERQRDALGHTLLSVDLGARGVHDATSFG